MSPSQNPENTSWFERATAKMLYAWDGHKVLVALMGQVFITMLGIGIVGPIMPLYARSFGVSA